jgi:DNA-binding protein H-NS
MIQNASRALKEKQSGKRKESIARIKEMAAAAGIVVEIHDPEKKSVRSGSKVAPKYRNPDNHEETWTGRGVMPKWMQALTNNGRDKSEFLI